jgi:phospholipase A2
MQETSLGWNGLTFLRSALPVDAISSITTSWAWPDSILHLQSQISALLITLGRGPGSLFEEVIADSEKAVECAWDAQVRLGEDLPIAERAFLRERRRRIRKSFAKLIGVPENEIDERDIPIVAIAGSGGGSNFISGVRTLKLI